MKKLAAVVLLLPFLGGCATMWRHYVISNSDIINDGKIVAVTDYCGHHYPDMRPTVADYQGALKAYLSVSSYNKKLLQQSDQKMERMIKTNPSDSLSHKLCLGLKPVFQKHTRNLRRLYSSMEGERQNDVANAFGGSASQQSSTNYSVYIPSMPSGKVDYRAPGLTGHTTHYMMGNGDLKQCTALNSGYQYCTPQ